VFSALLQGLHEHRCLVLVAAVVVFVVSYYGSALSALLPRMCRHVDAGRTIGANIT
jgi:hypothetical protein